MQDLRAAVKRVQRELLYLTRLQTKTINNLARVTRQLTKAQQQNSQKDIESLQRQAKRHIELLEQQTSSVRLAQSNLDALREIQAQKES